MPRVCELPLHYGSAPKWLFERMVKLSASIIEIMLGESSPQNFLGKISDPFWFQSLGCLLGFDWHSSGLTTTLCAALKQAVRIIGTDSIIIAGGKGRMALNTPQELSQYGEKTSYDVAHLIFASKTAAKVDSVALQDGYDLYHHTIFATRDGNWSIVQQGMNPKTGWARRYHWDSKELKDYVCEPHKAVISDNITKPLNLVALENSGVRKRITELANRKLEKNEKDLKYILSLRLPQNHSVLLSSFSLERINKALRKIYEKTPKDFLALIRIEGVGEKTVRALALVANLIYGETIVYKDPAIYSFAHGGKDGHPYPIKKEDYDRTITVLEKAIKAAKIGQKERLLSLKRLAQIF